MPVFAYEARTEDGQSAGGMINAASAAEAGRKLSELNYYMVKLGSAEVEGDYERSVRDDVSRLRASRKSVMWFMQQLAIMIETGIPIGDALETLSAQTKDPVMQEILADVSAAVHEGRPLSDALGAYPRTFSNVACAMIRASETSGTMSIILNRVSEYMMSDHNALSRLRGALMYPGFMFTMCISVTVFLMTVILPRFSAIYSSKGATLPAPTRILMSFSDVLMHYGLYLLAGAIALTLGAIWYFRTPAGRRIWDWLQLNLPLLGPLFAKMFQCRSFRAIGTLLEAGVQVGDAMQLAQSMSSNTLYRRLWKSVEEGITNGEHISVAIKASGLLPEPIVQMIDCGDRTGRTGFVFNRLADFLEQEYDRAVKVMSQFMEPLMVLFMGGIIGFVAIAMLLPMFKIASVVAH